MQKYYPNSTRTTVESGKLVVSPYWSIDITCPTGTHVYAVLDGTISTIGVDSGNKFLLLNTHFNGMQWWSRMSTCRIPRWSAWETKSPQAKQSRYLVPAGQPWHT